MGIGCAPHCIHRFAFVATPEDREASDELREEKRQMSPMTENELRRAPRGGGGGATRPAGAGDGRDSGNRSRAASPREGGDCGSGPRRRVGDHLELAVQYPVAVRLLK